MKVRYFKDSDTLFVELAGKLVSESLDFAADAVLDLAADGSLCAITLEQASTRAGMPQFSYEQILGQN